MTENYSWKWAKFSREEKIQKRETWRMSCCARHLQFLTSCISAEVSVLHSFSTEREMSSSSFLCKTVFSVIVTSLCSSIFCYKREKLICMSFPSCFILKTHTSSLMSSFSSAKSFVLFESSSLIFEFLFWCLAGFYSLFSWIWFEFYLFRCLLPSLNSKSLLHQKTLEAGGDRKFKKMTRDVQT